MQFGEKLLSLTFCRVRTGSQSPAYDGAMRIETLLSNDSDDVILYEEWESVEHHQAYVGWRVETGLADFLSSNGIELEITYHEPTSI